MQSIESSAPGLKTTALCLTKRFRHSWSDRESESGNRSGQTNCNIMIGKKYEIVHFLFCQLHSFFIEEKYQWRSYSIFMTKWVSRRTSGKSSLLRRWGGVNDEDDDDQENKRFGAAEVGSVAFPARTNKLKLKLWHNFQIGCCVCTEITKHLTLECKLDVIVMPRFQKLTFSSYLYISVYKSTSWLFELIFKNLCLVWMQMKGSPHCPCPVL